MEAPIIMESSREKYIEKRRLQNRMAQRRFRQRHSQQQQQQAVVAAAVAAEQQQQQQQQHHHHRQQEQQEQQVLDQPSQSRESSDPDEPQRPREQRVLSTTPTDELPSPSGFFDPITEFASYEPAFSPPGPLRPGKFGFCPLSVGYPNNMMLDMITALDMGSGLPACEDSSSGAEDVDAIMSPRPTPLSSAETAVAQLYNGYSKSPVHYDVDVGDADADFGPQQQQPQQPQQQQQHPPQAQPPQNGSTVGAAKWQSPLHIAAQKGHNRIVCVLLQHNIDCNESDSEGLTPLIHATIGGYEDVVSSLLAHGARVGSLDTQRRSALHWAVVHRREGLLRLLLKHCAGDRAVLDGYDASSKTPLHTAIDAGFEAGVQMLLEFGANIHYKAGVP